jgi:hypothetical protein
MTPARFPHSDTPGSQLGCQLPRAYRRLQRPSSALDAKASTMCPLQLVKHKHSTKTTKTHTTKTIHNKHTPPTHACGQYASIMGCSRPLSSNQTPRKHQPNQGHHVPFGLILQGPTVCQTNPCEDHQRVPHPPGKTRTGSTRHSSHHKDSVRR